VEDRNPISNQRRKKEKVDISTPASFPPPMLYTNNKTPPTQTALEIGLIALMMIKTNNKRERKEKKLYIYGIKLFIPPC
jgi:hypothetical protein